MGKRKHISEFALSLCSKGTMILHPKDIKRFEEENPEAKELADLCNIYLIGRRKRLSFVPESIGIEVHKITGQFNYSEEGEPRRVGFAFHGNTIVERAEISAYPHSKLTFYSNGEVAGSMPSHIASFMCHELEDLSLRNIEIVYVGMSYGSGNRSARDRLESHSTLQKVLADMNHDFPEDEALVLLVEYDEPRYLMSFDGRNKSLSIEKDRNVAADIYKNQKKLSRKLQICLAEAGLIRYFQPTYNKIYKQTFPSHSQRILKELYSSDMGGITVELNTEDIRLRTFSDARGCGTHHIASYDLFDVKSRRSFFDFDVIDRGAQAKDMSGPAF